MSDLPQEVQDALGKLLEGKEALSGDEEKLLEEHKDALGIEAEDA